MVNGKWRLKLSGGLPFSIHDLRFTAINPFTIYHLLFTIFSCYPRSSDTEDASFSRTESLVWRAPYSAQCRARVHVCRPLCLSVQETSSNTPGRSALLRSD